MAQRNAPNTSRNYYICARRCPVGDVHCVLRSQFDASMYCEALLLASVRRRPLSVLSVSHKSRQRSITLPGGSNGRPDRSLFLAAAPYNRHARGRNLQSENDGATYHVEAGSVFIRMTPGRVIALRWSHDAFRKFVIDKRWINCDRDARRHRVILKDVHKRPVTNALSLHFPISVFYSLLMAAIILFAQWCANRALLHRHGNGDTPRPEKRRRCVFMVALCNRADHYIFILFLSSFFLLSFFFLFFLA